jgi:hypothetical protein
MRRLLFFSRLAFICNLFFVLAFSIQLTNWIRDEQLRATIVVIGYVMGMVLNPLTVLAYGITAAVARRRLKELPAWLVTANVLFLVLQILYILYLNDPTHN